MTINYNREFHGQEKLASPQPMAVSGSLKCIYSGQTFCDNWVKSYNQYKRDFNKAQELFINAEQRLTQNTGYKKAHWMSGLYELQNGFNPVLRCFL